MSAQLLGSPCDVDYLQLIADRWCSVCAYYCACCQMFFLLLDANSYVNTINSWAEPHNANGVTPNTVIDSNDEPAGNNQQRMQGRGY